MGIHGGEAERVRIERLEEVRKRLVAIEGKTVPSGKRPRFSSVVGMKLVTASTQDLKGTPAPRGQVTSCNVTRQDILVRR